MCWTLVAMYWTGFPLLRYNDFCLASSYFSKGYLSQTKARRQESGNSALPSWLARHAYFIETAALQEDEIPPFKYVFPSKVILEDN